MTAIKTVALTFLAWGALESLVQAAPYSSWFGGSTNLQAWYANRAYANGGFYAPANSPAPGAVSSNWFNDPTYLSSLGVISSTAQAPAAAQVISAPAPVAAPAPMPAAPAAADAFLNFGAAPYASASSLTSGTPQPWFNSPAVISAFGGIPTPDQQASFTQSVLADVQQTFRLSGMNLSLTTDPNVPAHHMMSVVSGVSYPSNTGAIGITEVGSNGFGFIDKLSYATSIDQLAWAVAHNVSHELMHALGVSSHPDASGDYLDSATASWQMLTDPNTKFSPEAIRLLQAAIGSSGINNTVGAQLLKLADHPGNCRCQFCQTLGGSGVNGAQVLVQPVPEPATVAIWALSALAATAMIRKQSSRPAA